MKPRMMYHGGEYWEDPMLYPMYYDEPMWNEMAEMRDYDMKDGRMYYTSRGGSRSGENYSNSGSSNGSNGGYDSSMMRNSRAGRSGTSRMMYYEAKENGADKSKKLDEIKKYADDMIADVMEIIDDNASPEEKAVMKQKFTTLVSKLN